MSDRGWIRLLPWALATAAIALALTDVGLAAANGTNGPAQVVNLTLILVAIVGALVAGRQPRDATGWILCATAVVGGVAGSFWDYGYRVINFGAGPLNIGVIAFWIGSWIWVPAAAAGLPAVLIRLPDGRIPSRWRGIDWLAFVGSVAVAFTIATAPGQFDARVKIHNPFELAGADGWLLVLRWFGYAALGVAFSSSVVSLVTRLRHATGDEREQLKWITSAGVLVTVALLYCLARQVIDHEILFFALTPFFLSTLALPAATGIAIMKYRLYDIDLVINRTLVYGGLTAMLAGLYTFFVALAQKLVAFSGQRSDIVILLTAFVGAASFTPVKNRLQKAVDRRFAVHDPASVVDSMREQIEVIVNVLDAQRIARRLVDDSAATYQARCVFLRLGMNADAAPFHTSGDTAAAIVLRVILHSDGKEVGVLSLGERRRGAVYTPRDRLALQACADAVGEAINLWEGALRSQLQPAGH